MKCTCVRTQMQSMHVKVAFNFGDEKVESHMISTKVPLPEFPLWSLARSVRACACRVIKRTSYPAGKSKNLFYLV